MSTNRSMGTNRSMSTRKPLPPPPEPSSFYDDILPSYQMPIRQAPPPPQPDEAAVLATCAGFLDCVVRKEPRAMYDYIRADGHAALRRYEKLGAAIQHVTLGALAKRIEHMVMVSFKGKRIEETFEEPEVRIDDDLAMVWSKFRILIDGKVIASGRNVFCLHRSNGDPARAPRRGWKISMVADRNVPVGPEA